MIGHRTKGGSKRFKGGVKFSRLLLGSLGLAAAQSSMAQSSMNSSLTKHQPRMNSSALNYEPTASTKLDTIPDLEACMQLPEAQQLYYLLSKMRKVDVIKFSITNPSLLLSLAESHDLKYEYNHEKNSLEFIATNKKKYAELSMIDDVIRFFIKPTVSDAYFLLSLCIWTGAALVVGAAFPDNVLEAIIRLARAMNNIPEIPREPAEGLMERLRRIARDRLGLREEAEQGGGIRSRRGGRRGGRRDTRRS